MSSQLKDWGKIEKEIEEEEEGNNSLEKFFQNVYQNATDEQRRAMMKSFQTSGGTVLSTNWDEVKNKDYKGKDRLEPPKGQEWKRV